MNAIKTIREALVQTQSDFAAFLSVSRDLLAKSEAGLRFLPTAAILKLGAIEILLKSSPSRFTEIEEQPAQVKKKLLAQARNYDSLAELANLRLEMMRDRHFKCLKGLQIISILLANLPVGTASHYDKLCLEIMHARIRKKMNNCDAVAQALLQLKADVYSYHAERARAMMG